MNINFGKNEMNFIKKILYFSNIYFYIFIVIIIASVIKSIYSQEQNLFFMIGFMAFGSTLYITKVFERNLLKKILNKKMQFDILKLNRQKNKTGFSFLYPEIKGKIIIVAIFIIFITHIFILYKTDVPQKLKTLVGINISSFNDKIKKIENLKTENDVFEIFGKPEMEIYWFSENPEQKNVENRFNYGVIFNFDRVCGLRFEKAKDNDKNIFSAKFSTSKFKSITFGKSKKFVLNLLGNPLCKSLIYYNNTDLISCIIYIENNSVKSKVGFRPCDFFNNF